MSSSSQNQPAIAYFAPELIDNILGHLISSLDGTPSPHGDKKSPQYRALEALSLTSRIWQGPSQRRMFKHLVVKSGTRAERLIEGFAATGLQVYVKELVICFPRFDDEVPTLEKIKAANAVSRDNFLPLLALFPHVRDLSVIKPTFSQPSDSYITSLQSCASLPNIVRLSVRFNNRQSDVELLHDILSLTPNVVHLSIWSLSVYKNLEPIQKPPVSLPHLRGLDLFGGSFASTMVTSLEWFDDGSPNPSVRPLLELMGPALCKVHYKSYNSDRDMVAELASCTALEEFTCDVYHQELGGLLGTVANTIHTIIFVGRDAAHSAYDLLGDLSQRPTALATVKFESGPGYAHRQPMFSDEEEKEDFEAVVQACEQAGVELIVSRRLKGAAATEAIRPRR